jgi:hypothetical protein
MENISAADVSAPKAAYAAGITPEQMRQWISRERFEPQGDSDRDGRQWRRFAPVDVFRIAVAACIARYGFTVAEAFEIVHKHVDALTYGVAIISRRDAATRVEVPFSVLVARLRAEDATLVLSREKGCTSVEVQPSRAGLHLWAHEHYVLIRLDCIAESVARRLHRVADINLA